MRGLAVVALLMWVLLAGISAARAGEPPLNADAYRVVVSAYSDRLLFESELSFADGLLASAESSTGEAPVRLLNAFLLQPPGVADADIVSVLAKLTLGATFGRWCHISLHGINMYCFCPGAESVIFELYCTPSYEDREFYVGTVAVDP